MSENEIHKSKLSNWLEILQQESWQLELLISGFAIFLVGGLYDSMKSFTNSMNVISLGLGSDAMTMIPVIILFGAWLFLLINLIVHVLLRGLWISTIGLRYVSGDIDFDHLRYSKRFDSFLKKKIVSFDNYIERLERLCSVVFSFTFLIIFSLISLGLLLLFITLGLYLIDYLFLSFGESIKGNIQVTFAIIMLTTAFLYFVDFLTLGFFKRVKWLGRIYYPIYRFYGFITLANIYRPIYYNLIDNKFGRWVGRLIVPYVIIVLFLISMKIDSHQYFPDSTDNAIRHSYYMDTYAKDDNIIKKPIINSKFIANGYVEIFIPYIAIFDDYAIESICPDFVVTKQNGLKQALFQFNNDDLDEASVKMHQDSSAKCLESIYSIFINDSLITDNTFRLMKMPTYNERGLHTILDVEDYNRGPHELRIDKINPYFEESVDSMHTKNFVTIPFWIE